MADDPREAHDRVDMDGPDERALKNLVRDKEPIVLRRADFEGDLGHLTGQIYLTAAVFRQAARLAEEHAARGDEKAARAALERVVGMLKFEDEARVADGSEP